MANDHYDDIDDDRGWKSVDADNVALQPQAQSVAVIPLKPFAAMRSVPADGYTKHPATVVGLRYDTEEQEWFFVCVMDDGDSDIYVTEDNTVTADLSAIS